jgi:hypothetical protein
MSDALMDKFNAFTQQVADSLPLLEEMGYEVSTSLLKLSGFEIRHCNY